MITIAQMRALHLDWTRRQHEARTASGHGEFTGPAADADTVAEYVERLEQALRTLESMIGREQVANLPAGRWAWWRPEHFRPGDDALILGCWYPVVRINRWSLTVAPLVLLGQRRLDPRGRHEWTDIVSLDAVCGRRRGGYVVRHPLLATEGICTEVPEPSNHTGPVTGADAAPCGRAPVARLRLHHDGTFCGCDWRCRLDRYVLDRWLPPWTEQRLLCQPHLAEGQQHDPALHQPPVRVLEHLWPTPAGDPPSTSVQTSTRDRQQAAEPPTEGDHR